jgi:hypothetical protein
MSGATVEFGGRDPATVRSFEGSYAAARSSMKHAKKNPAEAGFVQMLKITLSCAC